jgi:hypothetical protein
VAVRRGCEVVVHGINATLDAHIDWVVFQVDIANDFNIILRIFQEFRAMRGAVVPSFPLCSFFLWLLSSFIFQSSFFLKGFVGHSFVYGHKIW